MVYYERNSSLQTTKILFQNEKVMLLEEKTRIPLSSRVEDRVGSETKFSFH